MYNYQRYLQEVVSQENQNHICPLGENSKYYHNWCNFQVNSFATNIAEMVFTGISLILALIILRNYFVIRKQKRSRNYNQYYGSAYRIAYISFLGWSICTFGRVIPNFLVFYTYMYNDLTQDTIPDNNYDPQLHSIIIYLNCLCTFLQFSSSFFINLLTWIVPFQFIKTLLEYLHNYRSCMLDFQISFKIRKWFQYLEWVKIYFKFIRNIFILIFLIQPLLFFLTQFQRCNYPTINYYIIATQSTIGLIFYAFSLYITYRMNKKRLINIQSRQKLQYSCSYVLLFLSLLIKLVINILFLVLLKPGSSGTYIPNHNCTNLNLDSTVSTFILAIRNLILHIIPISLTCYMYRPKINRIIQRQKSQEIDQTPQSSAENFTDKLYQASIID